MTAALCPPPAPSGPPARHRSLGPGALLLLAACHGGARSDDAPAGSTLASATASTSRAPSTQGAAASPDGGPPPAPDGGAPPAAAPVRLGLVGDVNVALSTGRLIHALATGGTLPAGVEAGFPFGGVRQRLGTVDLLVGNLECAVSLHGTPNVPRPFAAPLESLPVLRDVGFSVLSVANNHSSDLGPIGNLETVHNVEAAGLGVIGAQGGFGPEPQQALVRTVRGLRIGFLGYPNVSPAKAEADVRRAKAEVDLVVVLNHWGMEGCAEPTGFQRKLAHALVDAGADLVVGTHAHIIQPEERYHDRLIVYGLGDFVFPGNPGLPHHPGAYLEVDVDRQGVLARRFYRVRHDPNGAPSWLDEAAGEPPQLGAEPPQPCSEPPRLPLPPESPTDR
jgi:hypothetical protein